MSTATTTAEPATDRCPRCQRHYPNPRVRRCWTCSPGRPSPYQQQQKAEREAKAAGGFATIDAHRAARKAAKAGLASSVDAPETREARVAAESRRIDREKLLERADAILDALDGLGDDGDEDPPHEPTSDRASTRDESALGPTPSTIERVERCHDLAKIEAVKYQAEHQPGYTAKAAEERAKVRAERSGAGANGVRSYIPAEPKANPVEAAARTRPLPEPKPRRWTPKEDLDLVPDVPMPRAVVIPADAPPPAKVIGPAGAPVKAPEPKPEANGHAKATPEPVPPTPSPCIAESPRANLTVSFNGLVATSAPTSTLDPEVAAMQAVLDALGSLSEAARNRVLDWAARRLLHNGPVLGPEPARDEPKPEPSATEALLAGLRQIRSRPIV